MKIYRYKQAIAALFCLSTMASCSDMLDTTSDMVEFVDDNTLSTPQDLQYSLMGIVRQMQVIADRTVLLGEVRADLMVPTPKATTAIKNMAAGDFTEDNPYNKISDFYAVINSCNYYLANADTTLVRLGKKVFEKEYAAVKAYRAWTYLQMAKIYGAVPLVTTPVLTENEAELAMSAEKTDITGICNYFIDDLRKYIDTEFPQYEGVSQYIFIPVRVLMGEMCLWTGRYQEAATYLSQYLTMKGAPVITGMNKVEWAVNSQNDDYGSAGISTSFFPLFNGPSTSEIFSYIPMETSEFDGIASRLADVYNSTINNDYYFQITPSATIREISAAQTHISTRWQNNEVVAAWAAPKEGLYDDLQKGDLRLCDVYNKYTENRSETSQYSSEVQTIRKFSSVNYVTIYRRQEVYLLFAEALCRAGYPESAFCILRYGLRATNIKKYICEKERERAGILLSFDDEIFPKLTTQGVHAIGCGGVAEEKINGPDGTTKVDNDYYILPVPPEETSYEDSVQYMIPRVEDLIMQERVLELAFEGRRYYDLMRVAMRRNDNSYLATPISMRTGTKDEEVFNKLLDNKNWYLPLR